MLLGIRENFSVKSCPWIRPIFFPFNNNLLYGTYTKTYTHTNTQYMQKHTHTHTHEHTYTQMHTSHIRIHMHTQRHTRVENYNKQIKLLTKPFKLYYAWIFSRVRKPKNRISRIFSPAIAVCWSCQSISKATLKPNLPLLSLRIIAFLLFA